MCSLGHVGQNSKSRTFVYTLTMSHVKSFMSQVTLILSLISIPFILGLNCVYTKTKAKQIRAYHGHVYNIFCSVVFVYAKIWHNNASRAIKMNFVYMVMDKNWSLHVSSAFLQITCTDDVQGVLFILSKVKSMDLSNDFFFQTV